MEYYVLELSGPLHYLKLNFRVQLVYVNHHAHDCRIRCKRYFHAAGERY